MSASEIDVVIRLLSKLPGLGPRSARRATLHLLEKKENILVPLATALQDISDKVCACTTCGNFDSQPVCHICRDTGRHESRICVVETVSDLWALERSRAWDGRYHVLGGVLNALDGTGPGDLNIDSLLERVGDGQVEEIVLALGATVEGQTTAHYLAERLADQPVDISRLAHGVPVGGELEFLDDGTLSQALKARRPV